MTVLSAQTIRSLCDEDVYDAPMIYPFFERRVHKCGLSYGLSGASYDIRLAETIILWPHGFRLSYTMERFVMPLDVVGVVHDKSSLARSGIAVQNTFIDAGWKGYLMLELSNHRFLPRRLERGQPIAQIVFHRVDQVTEMPYDGKYQDQPAMPVKALMEVAS